MRAQRAERYVPLLKHPLMKLSDVEVRAGRGPCLFAQCDNLQTTGLIRCQLCGLHSDPID
jgi:hypothetical protein